MNLYYSRMVYRYFSKIEPDRGFDTEKESRAFDRDEAVRRLAEVTSFGAATPEHVAALRFLADEIEDVAREAPQMETT